MKNDEMLKEIIPTFPGNHSKAISGIKQIDCFFCYSSLRLPRTTWIEQCDAIYAAGWYKAILTNRDDTFFREWRSDTGVWCCSQHCQREILRVPKGLLTTIWWLEIKEHDDKRRYSAWLFSWELWRRRHLDGKYAIQYTEEETIVDREATKIILRESPIDFELTGLFEHPGDAYNLLKEREANESPGPRCQCWHMVR